MQSSIVIEPELSMECWNKLLDKIYEMARDIPWLREECGMILVEAVKSLKAQSQFEQCAEEAIVPLEVMSSEMARTPFTREIEVSSRSPSTTSATCDR